jgi:alpha-L-rhamnosidase
VKQIGIGPVTFERSPDGLGLGTACPRVSWTLPDGSADQRAYELEVHRVTGTTSTGRVPSPERSLVPWPVEPLRSRDRARVRVRVWTDDGLVPSRWSQPAWAEAALLEPADWVARPVGGAWPELELADRRPARVRRDFTVDRPVVAARLYATAHGLYEAEINGVRVGDDALSPGWTVYGKRLKYRTYDVTSHLVPGRNAIGAWLGDGWYRGRLGFNGGTRDIYGSDQSWLAQLEIRHDDGSVTTIATDESWQAAPGPILTSGLYDGEVHDARLADPAWSRPGGADGQCGPDGLCGSGSGGWTPVVVRDRDPATLEPDAGPPVRCTQEIAPAVVTLRDDGSYLLDFGQNLVGRLAITVSGSPGGCVTLHHAEVVIDGDLATDPLRQARATDEYILRGDGTERWEPRFTIHGFRYATVNGWPGAIAPGSVVARVYHTDMPPTGEFACSDPLIQRLHNNVRWSVRGNLVAIPTDCPARDERLGWTGDAQVFAPTALFMYDCTALFDSWLTDVGLEQFPDGTIPWYVPVIPGAPMWTPIRPGAGWGDAAVLVPAALYQATGDPELLRRHYRPARAWVDLIARLAGPSRLWDTGFQLGDWLDPTAPADDPAAGATNPYLIATAYFAWSARHVSLTARALGDLAGAAVYQALADEVAAAFRGRYLLDGGRLVSDSQTAYAIAIVFGLLDGASLVQRAGDRLAELVRDNGYRIGTGFVGTPLICDALTSTGHVADAYRMLTQTHCPSWLYPVTRGATTVWERWDSLRPDGTLNPDGMTSFNHVALGSVADWLHRTVAGLAPAEPGYRKIAFRPCPGGGLTSASASHQTPWGRAAISWRITAGELAVDMTIPPNCTGSAHLPGRDPFELPAGTHHLVLPHPLEQAPPLGDDTNA